MPKKNSEHQELIEMQFENVHKIIGEFKYEFEIKELLINFKHVIKRKKTYETYIQ